MTKSAAVNVLSKVTTYATACLQTGKLGTCDLALHLWLNYTLVKYKYLKTWRRFYFHLSANGPQLHPTLILFRSQPHGAPNPTLSGNGRIRAAQSDSCP